jgi:hypothetical protein
MGTLDKRHWWQEDWTQEIGLLMIGFMVCFCIVWPPKSPEAFAVVGTAIGAIGGYLTGKKYNENGGSNGKIP